MGFFGSILGLLEGGVGALALDTISALLNGAPPRVAQGMKDKSFRSEAYGNPIVRYRGTVRGQGQLWWATQIQLTWRKTTSGGIFGIGQSSVYYPMYSVSMFIGCGEKIGGGAAAQILRIWLDGKLLYNGIATNAKIVGTVTVTIVSGGQPAGSLNVQLTLASGASIQLNAGDLIQFNADPGYSYEVQAPVNATGPGTATVSIWPPLRVNLPGGGGVIIPGLNSSPWDLSSFDPDPHDGSHISGGYDCPPGGATFYLGSSSQQPDPTIVKWLGPGNVPGFTGRAGICLHDLQLRNYGNHPPQPSVEVAWDVATPQYPSVGPIANASGTVLQTQPASSQPENVLLPYSGPTALLNPFTQTLPYVWIDTSYGGGGGMLLYLVNTQNNQLVAQIASWTSEQCAPVVDAAGKLYVIANPAFSGPDSTLYEIDGLTGNTEATYSGPGNAGMGINPHGANGLYLWDYQASFFGNLEILKLIVVLGGGGFLFFLDRQYMLPYGVVDGVGTDQIIQGYDKKGNPSFGIGTVTSGGIGSPAGGANDSLCSDGNGNLWALDGSTLVKVTISYNPTPIFSSGSSIPTILFVPSFAATTINVSSIVTGGLGASGVIRYNPTDNTIVVISTSSNIGKVSCSTNAIIAGPVALLDATSSPINVALGVSQAIDIMGRLFVNTAISGTSWQVDVNAMQVVATYTTGPFFSGGLTSHHGAYDWLTDSAWIGFAPSGSPNGVLYRIFFDRSQGSGVGLDAIVSSLMLDAGYTTSQFDVTQLTAAGTTVYGLELDHESYLDSLKRLMQLYLFDAAEIDGKVVFVPRGQAPICTIPESDMGCLDTPDKYEPRMTETIEDEQNVPEWVSIRYYDPLKQDQQAVQYQKRVSNVYPSSLPNAKPLVHTKQRLDIASPITEQASVVKPLADKILWDAWAGRPGRKLKLPYGGSSTVAYWRLDPTDVVDLSYKGGTLETRLEEADLGATLAVEISGKNQDRSVYTNAFIPTGSAGQPSGGAPIGGGGQGAPDNSVYTINPAFPLSEVSTTDIHMVNVTATFKSGQQTFYNARDFTVPDPGAGNTATYYVTIGDPNFVGEVPGTTSLTAYVSTNPVTANWNQYGFIMMGVIVVAGTGASGGGQHVPGGNPGTGGAGVVVSEVAFGPTTRGNFQVAHNLGAIPTNVQIQITPPNGAVEFQAQRYDAQYVYLWASDDGLTGYLEIFN